MSLSNVSVVAFHYRSYGTFCIYSKSLHNLYSGFTTTEIIEPYIERLLRSLFLFFEVYGL